MPDNGFADTPAGDPAVPCDRPMHWIEISLTDENGKPVPNEAYSVKLPNGDTNTGFLNGDGVARLDGIPDAGTCQVSFPNIDGDDWQSASSAS